MTCNPRLGAAVSSLAYWLSWSSIEDCRSSLRIVPGMAYAPGGGSSGGWPGGGGGTGPGGRGNAAGTGGGTTAGAAPMPGEASSEGAACAAFCWAWACSLAASASLALVLLVGLASRVCGGGGTPIRSVTLRNCSGSRCASCISHSRSWAAYFWRYSVSISAFEMDAISGCSALLPNTPLAIGAASRLISLVVSYCSC